MLRKNFLRKFIDLLQTFTNNKNFFFNLVKNVELRKLFLNILNEYIIYEMDMEYKYNYSYLIIKFLNYYDLADIDKDDTYKKVYFEIIDCFLENFIKILKNRTTKNISFQYMQIFIEMLFQNKYYLKNITNLETLTKTFENIEISGPNIANNLSIYTIIIYTKYIATISEENIEKNSKLIEFFEKNIKKYIEVIKSLEITNENNIYSFNIIIKYLYNLNFYFEIEKFNNSILIKNIKKSFYAWITKIVIFELEKIDFKIENFHKNHIICSFLSLSPQKLVKNNFKNIISNKAIKRFIKINKILKDSESSKFINLTTSDKNFLEFVFFYEFINMNKIENSNLILEFLENYKDNISKSINNYKDAEFFIVLSFYIMNLVKKLDMEKNFKNNYLEKLNNFLEFKAEIHKFFDNKNIKYFKKSFTANFINAIINSDLKIFEKLEKLNEEKFKVLIINLIDNFRKLDKFYDTETNNNPEFRKIYNDFKNNIFYYKIEKKWSENYLDEIPIFYWHETQIRREIYEHFENIFIFNSSDSENKFLSQQKSLRSE